MLSNSLKIISFPDIELWQRCLDTIRTSCKKDLLYKNYVNLVPNSFYYFTSLIYEGEIISFGAIEHSPPKWGPEIARVLTRFWIHPKFRSKHLTKWSDNNLRFSPIVLNDQINFLRNQDKIKIAMITREGKYSKSFKEIIRLSKSVENDFEIIPGIFNVCRYTDVVPQSCKQMIAVARITNIDKISVLQKYQDQGCLTKILDE